MGWANYGIEARLKTNGKPDEALKSDRMKALKKQSGGKKEN